VVIFDFTNADAVEGRDADEADGHDDHEREEGDSG